MENKQNFEKNVIRREQSIASRVWIIITPSLVSVPRGRLTGFSELVQVGMSNKGKRREECSHCFVRNKGPLFSCSFWRVISTLRAHWREV